MPILIRDGDFSDNADHATQFLTTTDLTGEIAGLVSLDLENDEAVDQLAEYFDQIGLIRIAFPGFADGRGYSLARRLRQLGFRGTLRAHGHLIPDQYPHAIRAGFNEIEISVGLAEQKPAHQWQQQFAAMATSYQDRLQRPQL